MCRIGGRQRSGSASYQGVNGEIPPFIFLIPNPRRAGRHCVVGSLTGVVASKRVSEAFKGMLSTFGNRTRSAIAKACLTVRQTGRSGTKVGYSDPAVLYGRAVAQRIKGTPGITG